jgi:hypothetical protein
MLDSDTLEEPNLVAQINHSHHHNVILMIIADDGKRLFLLR